MFSALFVSLIEPFLFHFFIASGCCFCYFECFNCDVWFSLFALFWFCCCSVCFMFLVLKWNFWYCQPLISIFPLCFWFVVIISFLLFFDSLDTYICFIFSFRFFIWMRCSFQSFRKLKWKREMRNSFGEIFLKSIFFRGKKTKKYIFSFVLLVLLLWLLSLLAFYFLFTYIHSLI